MYTKLTLNVDKDTIEQAKLYAKKQNLSLSKLIESYLKSLVKPVRSADEISPIVAQLTGIIAPDYQEKEAYISHQIQKHS